MKHTMWVLTKSFLLNFANEELNQIKIYKNRNASNRLLMREIRSASSKNHFKPSFSLSPFISTCELVRVCVCVSHIRMIEHEIRHTSLLLFLPQTGKNRTGKTIVPTKKMSTYMYAFSNNIFKHSEWKVLRQTGKIKYR